MINKIKLVVLTSTKWSWSCVRTIEPHGAKNRPKVFIPGKLGESRQGWS